jgi:hypothetical protein
VSKTPESGYELFFRETPKTTKRVLSTAIAHTRATGAEGVESAATARAAASQTESEVTNVTLVAAVFGRFARLRHSESVAAEPESRILNPLSIASGVAPEGEPHG